MRQIINDMNVIDVRNRTPQRTGYRRSQSKLWITVVGHKKKTSKG